MQALPVLVHQGHSAAEAGYDEVSIHELCRVMSHETLCLNVRQHRRLAPASDNLLYRQASSSRGTILKRTGDMSFYSFF